MLHWQWDEKCGYITETYGDRSYTYTLYKGNALLIMLSEWEENGQGMYCMHSFFCDKEHAKNMLGLNKDTENVYEGYDIELTLYVDKCDYKTLVDYFVKSGTNCKIHLMKSPD